MATGATLIDRALRLLEQVSSGTTATDDEYDDGLIALNALIDAWRNERLLCWATQTETLSLVATTTSYAIGPAGDLNTVRPVAVEGAWITSDGVDYPVGLLTDQEYDQIRLKTSESDWPRYANYRATMPTGTLYVWPPANGAATMNLRTRTPVSALALANTVSLPPGWEEALAFNLAISIAPEYGVEPSNAVVKRATESLAAIKRMNSQPVKAWSDLAYLFGRGRPNILTGE